MPEENKTPDDLAQAILKGIFGALNPDAEGDPEGAPDWTSNLANPAPGVYVGDISKPETQPAPPPPIQRSFMDELKNLGFTIAENVYGDNSAILADPRGRDYGSITVAEVDDDDFAEGMIAITHASQYTESYTVYLKSEKDALNCIQNSLASAAQLY